MCNEYTIEVEPILGGEGYEFTFRNVEGEGTWAKIVAPQDDAPEFARALGVLARAINERLHQGHTPMAWDPQTRIALEAHGIKVYAYEETDNYHISVMIPHTLTRRDGDETVYLHFTHPAQAEHFERLASRLVTIVTNDIVTPKA